MSLKTLISCKDDLKGTKGEKTKIDTADLFEKILIKQIIKVLDKITENINKQIMGQRNEMISEFSEDINKKI